MKFACLCLHALTANELLNARGGLAAGFSIESPMPQFDLKIWIEAVGRWQIDEIEASNVHIWTTAESKRPDVLDSENDRLADRLHAFWKGMLLNRPPPVRSAWILSGSIKDGKPDVRMFTRINQIYIKEPQLPLSVERLQRSAETAEHLERAFVNGLGGRIERGLAALLGSMSSQYVDESILALQRSLEGILHPNDKSQFVKRAIRVVKLTTQPATDLFEEVYGVRSGFTHAQPVEAVFPRSSGEGALQRARQLQALLYLTASRAYRAVLADPNLVERFSREGQGEYWGKVVGGKKSPPFEVEVKDDEWLFAHDEMHYVQGEDVFTRPSNIALQLTSPSLTLGPRS